MVNYSKRINFVRVTDIGEKSSIFFDKMCVFVSRPMKFVTLLLKNGETPKWVVDFHRERDTFRNTIMEIVENYDEKSYNNNGKPWKSSRILRVNPCFSFFFLFSSFFSIFFSFSVFFFLFFSFFIFFMIFSFFIFLFFHFLSFSFIFFVFVGCSKSDFFRASISLTTSLDNSYVKNQFLDPSRGEGGRRGSPLGPLFLFFPPLCFSRFFVFFLVFFFFF